MLVELPPRTPQPAEHRRRWFTDELWDLIVWFEPDDTVFGFQLCFDKTVGERALTWRRDSGYRLDQVDDGESSPSRNRTPLIRANGKELDSDWLAGEFIGVAQELEPWLKALVVQKIREYR